jgi:hypothetical protein
LISPIQPRDLLTRKLRVDDRAKFETAVEHKGQIATIPRREPAGSQLHLPGVDVEDGVELYVRGTVGHCGVVLVISGLTQILERAVVITRQTPRAPYEGSSRPPTTTADSTLTVAFRL